MDEAIIERLTESCLKADFLMDFDDTESVKTALVNSMVHTVGKDPRRATGRDWFYAMAFLVRAILSERNIKTARAHARQDTKMVYYLSMEYLIGRSLGKHLHDLGLHGIFSQALAECGQDIDAIKDFEFDAALGNGGLGRLAACFLDSLATHQYPGFGYGIRYEYGMFTQRIENGEQVERPENWLRYGNPWEIERPEVLFPVRYHGRVVKYRDERGVDHMEWVDTDNVVAIAYDVPVSGFHTPTVNNLRLWSAKASRDFDLMTFNQGNYMEAVRDKTISENLSKVLYPNDQTQIGQELRLMQEYFFVSASIQDIVTRFERDHDGLDQFPDKVAIQLNDTHPALAVPELVRVLMERRGKGFEDAWALAQRTFAYTNHTLLPEALETWRVEMLQRVLPYHLEIVYWINEAFLDTVRRQCPGDVHILRRVSLVNDDTHAIRMAHLAVVGSHKVNGVAALHTKLLRATMFPDFDRLFPGKFVNMTNGITPRRWLLHANPPLSSLITECIGPAWTKDLSRLHDLIPYADDAGFRERFRAIKRANRERLGARIRDAVGLSVDPDSLFDVQVKRIHEYKRQLLNLMHVITHYNRLRDGQGADKVPRTVVFGGKAAPGYWMAKQIIRLINDVADVVNNDPAVKGYLKVVFWPNYNVSAAHVIMPGTDLSEQISTAGTEASGTGNMKFALNGALTIGTLDGANIEIREEVGDDNIFIFGMDAREVEELTLSGYDPGHYYHSNEDLRRVLDMIQNGHFSSREPSRYRPITEALLQHGDRFFLLADYRSYIECQERVDQAWRDPEDWTRRAVLNVANMGKFSSDRTIHGYSDEIWGIKPVEM